MLIKDVEVKVCYKNTGAEKDHCSNEDTSAITINDWYEIELLMRGDYVATNEAPLWPVNTCYALSKCDPDGIGGTKKPYKRIDITADRELYGVPAGEPLNAFIKEKYFHRTLDSMDYNLFSNTAIYLTFVDAPRDSIYRTFTAEVEFEDGQILTGETPRMRFVE